MAGLVCAQYINSQLRCWPLNGLKKSSLSVRPSHKGMPDTQADSSPMYNNKQDSILFPQSYNWTRTSCSFYHALLTWFIFYPIENLVYSTTPISQSLAQLLQSIKSSVFTLFILTLKTLKPRCCDNLGIRP